MQCPRGMHATHPHGALSIQRSFLGPHPMPSGRPEGHRSGTRGSGKLQADSSCGWHGWVAQPHLRLGFPPLSLQAESAGPQTPWVPVPYKWGWGHMGNLGEECPMSTAQDSCHPLPPLATIAMCLSLRAGWGCGELRWQALLPCPRLSCWHSPDDKGFPPLTPLHIYWSCILTS